MPDKEKPHRIGWHSKTIKKRAKHPKQPSQAALKRELDAALENQEKRRREKAGLPEIDPAKKLGWRGQHFRTSTRGEL